MGGSALDLSGHRSYVEGQAGRHELAQEVPIALGAGTGHQPDPEGHRRNGQGPVAIEEALVGQCLDDAGSLGGQLAQQCIGIELGEDEADVAPRLVQLHLAPDPDDQTGLQGDAQLVERGADPRPSARPAHHLQDRRPRVLGTPRIDEVDVAVSPGADVERTHLPRDPDLSGQGST